MNLQSVIDKKKEAAEYMVSEITHICKDFEKRDPGSKGEQQACEYMADVLKNLLELVDLVDNAEDNIESVADSVNAEALGHIVPGVIIIGQGRILSRKCNGLHARLGHRGAVAAADGVMYAAVGLALNTELRESILEHCLKILVEAAELPIVLDNNLEIVLIGDGVQIYVPRVFKNGLALMSAGESERTAESRLLGAAVEVDDAQFSILSGFSLKYFVTA